MNTLTKSNHDIDRNFDVNDLLTPLFFNSRTVVFNSPGTGVKEADGKYDYEISVPGLTKKDIVVTVENGVMTVTVQKKEPWKNGLSRRQVQYAFTLPGDADVNNTKAKCRHGMLTITIGKTRKNHRHIPVFGERNGSPVRPAVLSWWATLKARVSRRRK